MSLPFGLLGLLNYKDSTGYDLSKMFAESLNNFWHAQTSQIYRELNRMEHKGLVVSQSVIQDKRPNKRVYSITEGGRVVLQEWLTQSIFEFENTHEPLLVRVFFGAYSPDTTLALLNTCRDVCKSALEELPKQVAPNIERYAAIIPDGKDSQPYWEMTLDFGVAQFRMVLEWAERCIEVMEEMRA